MPASLLVTTRCASGATTSGSSTYVAAGFSGSIRPSSAAPSPGPLPGVPDELVMGTGYVVGPTGPVTGSFPRREHGAEALARPERRRERVEDTVVQEHDRVLPGAFPHARERRVDERTADPGAARRAGHVQEHQVGDRSGRDRPGDRPGPLRRLDRDHAQDVLAELPGRAPASLGPGRRRDEERRGRVRHRARDLGREVLPGSGAHPGGTHELVVRELGKLVRHERRDVVGRRVAHDRSGTTPRRGGRRPAPRRQVDGRPHPVRGERRDGLDVPARPQQDHAVVARGRSHLAHAVAVGRSARVPGDARRPGGEERRDRARDVRAGRPRAQPVLAQRAEQRCRGGRADVAGREETCSPGPVGQPDREQPPVVRSGAQVRDRDERVERADPRAVLGLERGQIVGVRRPGRRHRPASRASGAPSGRPRTTHSWSV